MELISNYIQLLSQKVFLVLLGFFLIRISNSMMLKAKEKA